jgi:ribonuclease P protein component
MSRDTAIAPPLKTPEARKATRADSHGGRKWVSLEQRSDFLRLSASGLKRVTPAFILQAAPRRSDASTPIHVGFTASRKVGNAVARNRAKRRLRALTDLLIAEADPALDYVLIGRTETLTRAFGTMEKELRHAFLKIKAPRTPPHTGGARS